MEMLASPGCDPALRGQPVKAATGASLEVALTGWERVLPHRKNDWPIFFPSLAFFLISPHIASFLSLHKI